MNASATRKMLDVISFCRAPADFDEAGRAIDLMSKREMRAVIGFLCSASADAADNVESTAEELAQIRLLVERYGDKWTDHFYGTEAHSG